LTIHPPSLVSLTSTSGPVLVTAWFSS
jgi:hypothetical protein